VCGAVTGLLVARPFSAPQHSGTNASSPSTAVSAGRVPVAPILPPTAAWGLETASQTAAVRRLAINGLPRYCAGKSKPMVALTFDDGPGVYTHFAIKKLREYHLVATFFLVGKEIRAWPGWAEREKPYAVFGDHTLTHPFLPALGQSQMVGEISGAKAMIERTVGEPVVLFRPPYEGRTPAIDREVRSLGMLEVLWNVDSQDSLGANYAGIERNVIAGLHPGAVILMHENRGQTIRALPTIFAALARRHLQAVTVPQLIAEDPPSLAQLRAGEHGCAVTHATGNGS
jgi:peptidoglycan-N-acetylglucosamine deacetylase